MSFLDSLKNETNFDFTENGAVKHKTTKSDILDMFALCGSYRNRSEEDCITMLENALKENETLAVKCLFYLADCRGGQGERRFFRVCYRWLANKHTEIALRNLKAIPEYRRWDDILYSCVGTPIENDALAFIKEQFILDIQCKTPSLLAKWLPSENASSAETKRMGNIVREYLGMTHKQYRKSLAELRSRINIVEKLMYQNRWDEIEFDKIPSKAGLVYKNAFARRDMIAKKYENFIKSDDTKVNASVLNPVDITHRAFNCKYKVDEVERVALQKYWDNLPNYYGDRTENAIAIVDVSGSMMGVPMEAAVGMGAYIAEHAHGIFADHFITFSSEPHLVRFNGVDIVDKLQRCKDADWGYNTNLEAVFDLLLNTALKHKTPQSEMPERLYIFSDMEFDRGCGFTYSPWGSRSKYSSSDKDTLFEAIAEKWARYGYELPPVLFWNLDARTQNIPALGGRYSYISGFSPSMIETILSGKSGYDLMLEKLLSARYEMIK